MSRWSSTSRWSPTTPTRRPLRKTPSRSRWEISSPTVSPFDIDDLLQQTIPSDRPPPVIPDVPPPPPVPDIPIPPPLFGMPMVQEEQAPEPPPSAPPRTRSSNAPSARGVDELLQDFM